MTIKLKKAYKGCTAKKYDDVKDFFTDILEFNLMELCDDNEISIINRINSRVWLLFASVEEKDWYCLQVGHSKSNVRGEIEDIIMYLLDSKTCEYNDKMSFKNSAFYREICPKVSSEDYRKELYRKIGKDFNYFRICFLDVNKYLGIGGWDKENTTEIRHIVEICKNQYAEAKIAYETLAVYWRCYSSGIDGQTLEYILSHQRDYNSY